MFRVSTVNRFSRFLRPAIMVPTDFSEAFSSSSVNSYQGENVHNKYYRCTSFPTPRQRKQHMELPVQKKYVYTSTSVRETQSALYKSSTSRRNSLPPYGDTENSFEDAVAALPEGAQLQLDFFGEPITFLGVSSKDTTSNAMAALDGFLLAIVSKGKTCIGGGEEEGLEVQSTHSSAIAWSELLRHATVWNNDYHHSNNKQHEQQHQHKQHPNDNKQHNHNQTDSNQQQEQEQQLNKSKSAPMLVVAAVAPLLAQGVGIGYIRYLDGLLKQVESGVPGLDGPLQMIPMVEHVLSRHYRPRQQSANPLNFREVSHVKALYYMFHNQPSIALYTLLELLRSCPGDVLALSLVMDLANTVGDPHMALRAASSVAAYWNERKGGLIRPTIPGYAVACAYQALGFAVGGRAREAEELATRAMSQTGGKKVCGGVSTWALAHVFDLEGRTAEGISFLANHDGVQNYEGSGLLFFQSRLATYGARYLLDREERGRGKSAALRLYDSHIEHVLKYSGFGQGQRWQSPQRKAPLAWVDHGDTAPKNESSPPGGILNFVSNLWGKDHKGKERNNNTSNNNSPTQEEQEADTEIIVQEQHVPSSRLDDWKPSCEDIFTWLPPTPQLLTDATLLLWRMTLNGTVFSQDYRWSRLHNAWRVLFDLEEEHYHCPKDTTATTYVHQRNNTTPSYAPLACLVASLLIPPVMSGGDQIGTGRLATGLHRMGELMQLGDIATRASTSSEEESDSGGEGLALIDGLRLFVAEKQPDFWLPSADDEQRKWKSIVDHLCSALDGVDYDDEEDNNDGQRRIISHCERSLRLESWTFDARPLLDHAIVYAACKAGDNESLCRARSICSQGVTLRPNSPEEWWRYSIVLGLLGDEIASEDALAASVNLGAGQGAKAI